MLGRMGIGNGTLFDSTMQLIEGVGGSLVLQGRKFRIAVNGIKIIKKRLLCGREISLKRLRTEFWTSGFADGIRLWKKRWKIA